jgi:UDPglucose 6-dehydrogenase
MRIDRLAQLTQSHLGDRDAVGILGLAYKPGTGVAEESAGVELARLMANAGYDVYVYDPAVTDATLTQLGLTARHCRSLEELFEQCDVAVITTSWPEFADLPAEALSSVSGQRPVVIDCWRMLAEGKLGDFVDVIRLGQHRPSRVETEAL